MTSTLLTDATLEWQHWLDDAVRVVRWSAHGRLMVVAADGCVLIDQPANVTRPTCGEPRDADWIGEGRLGIADSRGVLFVGGGEVRTVPGQHMAAARAYGATLVVASGTHLIVWDERSGRSGQLRNPRCGRVRDVAAVTSSSWVVAGSTGVVLVDLRLDATDGRIDLPGAVSVRPDPAGRMVAVGVLAGCIHLWQIGVDEATQCLDGYPDRVRHIGWGAQSQFVVAAADDELTWWPIDRQCRARTEPDRAIGHDHPITALAVGDNSLTCSGDAAGGSVCGRLARPASRYGPRPCTERSPPQRGRHAANVSASAPAMATSRCGV